MNRIRVSSFDEIEEEFIRRAHAAVWCSLATLDISNRLRSRIMHPVWEGLTGWIATRRGSLKAKHLAHSPYVSLAYIADAVRPVYVDCIAEWDDRLESKRHVWEKFSSLTHFEFLEAKCAHIAVVTAEAKRRERFTAESVSFRKIIDWRLIDSPQSEQLRR